MRSTQLLIRFLLGALLLAGCDGNEEIPDSGSSDAGATTDAGASDGGHTTHEDAGPSVHPSVVIAFEHLANGTPIVLGTETPYTNAAGNAFGVTRLSYFVSDLTVTTAHGMTYSVPGAHYVDHDTAATRLLEIPVDAHSVDLASISFVMGLPPELNVTGAFTSPPESLMEWPVMMGGGYHYMKLEGRYIDTTGEPFNMMVHSGGLNGTDYSFPVELQAHGIAIGDGDVTLTIAMNVEEWFTNPNDWDLNVYFNAERRGIMGNAAAQASLQENGLGVFTLESP